MSFVHMVGRVRPGGKVDFKIDSDINRGAGEAQQGWKLGDASRIEPGAAPWARLISDHAPSLPGMHLKCRREGSRQSELHALYLLARLCKSNHAANSTTLRQADARSAGGSASNRSDSPLAGCVNASWVA
jgi:hypothetical protein